MATGYRASGKIPSEWLNPAFNLIIRKTIREPHLHRGRTGWKWFHLRHDDSLLVLSGYKVQGSLATQVLLNAVICQVLPATKTGVVAPMKLRLCRSALYQDGWNLVTQVTEGSP